jgi:hypothetical protein
MGGQVPPHKTRAEHRIIIQLAGPLSKVNARALKKELDRALDKYRSKVRKKTSRRRKRQS